MLLVYLIVGYTRRKIFIQLLGLHVVELFLCRFIVILFKWDCFHFTFKVCITRNYTYNCSSQFSKPRVKKRPQVSSWCFLTGHICMLGIFMYSFDSCIYVISCIIVTCSVFGFFGDCWGCKGLHSSAVLLLIYYSQMVYIYPFCWFCFLVAWYKCTRWRMYSCTISTCTRCTCFVKLWNP